MMLMAAGRSGASNNAALLSMVSPRIDDNDINENNNRSNDNNSIG